MMEFLVKHAYINRKIIKYVISGGTAASIDILLLFLFTDILGMWYLLSSFLAFLVAFFISFYLQKYWTFRDKNKKKIYRQMFKYFFVGGVNIAINTGGVYLLVDKFDIHYIIAQIIMGAIIGASSFIIYGLMIFKKHKAQKRKKAGDMRVLIATGIFPPDIGGPATMLKALIESFVKNGFEIKVITYADNGGKSILYYDDKKVKVYKIKRKSGIFVRYFLYLRRILELSKWSDVIYTTDTYSVGYFAYLAKKILGKKYIVRFAGDSAWETSASNGWTKDYITDFQKNSYNSKIKKLKSRTRKILTNADNVIAVSNFMSDLAKIIGVSADKIRIIYNSVDFMDKKEVKEDEVAKIKNKYGSGEKIIVTSCRLTSWKGVDGIIKIISRLRESVGDINFLVLGDGPELENLKRLAVKLGVDGRVHFLGRVKHEDTMNYFKAADLYILNSNYEGLSHAILDAMKSGAPIITTNAGGNPELIENKKDGLLVEYNNESELLEASKKILNNKDLSVYLTANANNKLKKFNWDNTINKTIDLLKKYG